ncbi:MAG: dihydropteroate synthase [Gammaproteobacteria bacterium]|nr:dihydropteroate synthase [Gammaproteobacteria bacterium]MBU1415326.1 dihydropteroate synthase [Gammaproteobacteria bacterium]
MTRILHCGRYHLDLSQPRVMGIVNLTDDSFSGDGLHGQVAKAVAQGLHMIEAGADLLDLGAESSRPGAEPVSAQQELDRLLPVLEGLRGSGVPLSVDTVKPEVMRAAVAAGADLINDVAALRAPGALEAVADTGVAVCLMHMQGDPRTMQDDPRYDDVVTEVAEYLQQRVLACVEAGIVRERIVIDPGFGFGKTLGHNLALLRELGRLVDSGVPVLVGLSRKSMFGAITGKPVGDRVQASVAAALLAVQRGASIVRVHDVAATRDALAVLQVIEGA